MTQEHHLWGWGGDIVLSLKPEGWEYEESHVPFLDYGPLGSTTLSPVLWGWVGLGSGSLRALGVT